MGRLSKGVLIYGITSAFSRLATLLLLPVLTTYLTPAEHGVLSLLSVGTALLVPLLSVGLGAAAGACYFEGNDVDRKAATIWTSMIMMVPGLVLLALAALLLPATLSLLLFHSADFERPVAITLLATACTVASLPFAMYLQFEERAGTYAGVMLASSAVSVIATLLGVVGLRLAIAGVVYATFIGQAALVGLLTLVVGIHLPLRFSRAVLRDLIRLGLPLVPAFGFVFMLQHGNKFLVQRFSGLNALGIYTLGFNLGLAPSVLVGAFQVAWLPFAMSFAECRDEARTVFGRVLTYYVVAGGLVTVLFFVGARSVVLLLATPKFHDAYKVVGFSAAAQFFSGAFSILLPAVYFARQVQYVTVVQGVAAIAALALNVLLIPRLGISGAGLALAAGSLLVAALQHVWNVMRGSAYLPVTYEWPRVGRVLALYGIIAALTLWPRAISIKLEVLFAAATALCAFAVAYFVLTAPERTALRQAARNLRPSVCADAA